MQYSKRYQGISPSITLAITAKAAKMKADGIDVISFGAGEPDFRTPDFIRKEASEAMETKKIGYTASSGLPDLRKAIANKLLNDNSLSYDPSQIVVSNGAKHALHNALNAIINPGDEVILPSPYWVSYEELIKMAGGIPVIVETKEENDFKITFQDLEKAVTIKTKGLILNSPSNPCGCAYSKEELKCIGNLAVDKDFMIISDEIYEKLLYDGEFISVASLSKEIQDHTIVINGVSKAYAMTGWRIGYTASNKTVAGIIGNMQSHATSNPNTIAQYASIMAMEGPQDTVIEMKEAFRKRRDLMVELVNAIEGLSCRKPAGAFYVMVNIAKVKGKIWGGKKRDSSLDICDYLLDEVRVAAVPGSGFGADDYIRLSYATSEENIIEGLKRVAKAFA